MNLYELNKIVGAVLGSLLLLMVLNEIGNAMVQPTLLDKPAIAIGEEEDEAEKEEAKEEEKSDEPSLAALLADGDADRGAKVAKKCAACHSFDKGGKNKIGPALYGVIGRDKGQGENFKYSPALLSAGGEWSYADLDSYLIDPKAFMPGTKMVFKGLKKPSDRAHLIAYLRQAHDSPPPLPGE
ncbi:MAG: cytochrome c family protein [Alphaproteobacteria bacterium]|jgi:cytochrome c|nr:cytochrome c family protein [Alphaproteobacteria bacterium]MDP6812445.1 cytochrome c family protein [Alphaproteobacteria bacterium]